MTHHPDSSSGGKSHRGQTCGAGLVALAMLLPLLVLDLAASWQAKPPSRVGEMLVYFGTYTTGTSRGIYVSRLDLASGKLAPPELAAETPNPSFLAVHPRGASLYAANEVDTFNGQSGGGVSAFAVDWAGGRLTPLNQQSSRGAGAVHLVVDKAGRNVLVANYGGGSVAVLPIGPDGRLKPASAFIQHAAPESTGDRRPRPRAHAINLDPPNRFAYVPDLGLDQIRVYRFGSAAGSLVPADPPFVALDPGAGPRHFAFHPQGRFAYVINEKNMTLVAFSQDAERGGLAPIQPISTLPPGEPFEVGYTTAEVQAHPSGRFLYGSNRGHNSIAVFAIDPASGQLRFVEAKPTQGSTPRGFGIDPTGSYLLVANQRSDSVVVFHIDPASGRLTATGHTIAIGAPSSVEFVAPAARR